MQNYANLGGDSGVISFELGYDYIVVKFEDQGRWTTYRYTYSSAGKGVVEEMKRLALAGQGLNGFIHETHSPYESKQ